MSAQKNKNKEKKSQAHIELEKRFEKMQSQLLQTQIQLKSLYDQNAILGMNSHQYQKENTELKIYVKQEIQKLNFGLDNFRTRVGELTSTKNELEIQLATLKAKLQFQRKEHDDWRKDKERELEDCKRHYIGELARYENQATEYSVAIAQRQTILNQRTNLNKMLIDERQDYRRQLADKDRIKMQALDNLKKEMIDKFRDMKTSLLAIRREQLNNNTRLTLLQNHQLVHELELQSTQTEDIIKRNSELEKKIRELENQMGVQQEVEKEIAKRAVFSKKLLKNYYEKSIGLQKEKGELSQIRNKEETEIRQLQTLSNKIAILEDALNKTHAKIQELEKQNSLKSAELYQFKKQSDSLQKESTQFAKLLCRFYNELLSGQLQSAPQSPPLDFKALKMQNVNQWKLCEVQTITKSLLHHLKPHLKISLLDMGAWRKIMQDKLPLPNPANNADLTNIQDRQNFKCNTQYINSISLQKNKIYYSNKRKLQGVKNYRSLTKLPHEHSISFGKYVQAHVRQWGPEIRKKHQDPADRLPHQNYNLVEKFRRPIKTKLK